MAPHHTSWSLEAGFQLEARADEVKCVHLGIQYKNQPLFFLHSLAEREIMPEESTLVPPVAWAAQYQG